MASAVDWSGLTGHDPNVEDVVLIEATCPTGCELALEKEIRAKFGGGQQEVKTVRHQGRVFLDHPLDRVPEILQLRVVDNAYVLLRVVESADFAKDNKELCLDKLIDITLKQQKGEWKKGLVAWNKVHKYYPNSAQLIAGKISQHPQPLIFDAHALLQLPVEAKNQVCP